VTDEHFELASKSAAPGAAKGLNTNEVETAQALISSVFNSLQLGDSRIVGDEGLESSANSSEFTQILADALHHALQNQLQGDGGTARKPR